MQVKGGKEVTLTPGQTFYEGPDDVHVVGRNASSTKPAKFVVFFIKKQGRSGVSAGAGMKSTEPQTNSECVGDHQLGKEIEEMKESTFEGVGGLKIFTRSWQPEGKTRGVVVIVPGFNSHSGQYLWVGEQFAAKDLAAYAIDLRGRGRSEGERYYVEKMEDYTDDVATLVRTAKSENPGFAGVRSRSQRRRCRFVRLCARPSIRDRRINLRELRIRSAGARYRSFVYQGIELHHKAHPCLPLEERSFLPRSAGCRFNEQ